MLTRGDLLDLEEEIYKLTGLLNLLEIWACNSEGYEVLYISEGLNDIAKNIRKILKLTDPET